LRNANESQLFYSLKLKVSDDVDTEKCVQFVVVLCQPKLVVSANCGVEVKKIIDYKLLLDQAIELSSWKPQTCIIYNRKHEQVS